MVTEQEYKKFKRRECWLWVVCDLKCAAMWLMLIGLLVYPVMVIMDLARTIR